MQKIYYVGARFSRPHGVGAEVDFIAYGPCGFHAFEIKHTQNISLKHLRGLYSFARDYPEAKLHLLYRGKQTLYKKNITIYPFEKALAELPKLLSITETLFFHPLARRKKARSVRTKVPPLFLHLLLHLMHE